MSTNLISTLPDDFFKLIPLVSFLNLSCNRLKEVPSSISEATALISLELVSTLKYFLILYQACNEITSFPHLEKLHKLLRLNLTANALSKSPNFSSFDSLRYLSLAYNRIRELGRKLKYIHISLII
jgi:Leucine-rich repeat (LRR) protein